MNFETEYLDFSEIPHYGTRQLIFQSNMTSQYTHLVVASIVVVRSRRLLLQSVQRDATNRVRDSSVPVLTDPGLASGGGHAAEGADGGVRGSSPRETYQLRLHRIPATCAGEDREAYAGSAQVFASSAS